MKHRLLLFTLFLALAGSRAMATVFTVTSNADTGPGTLRDALTKAAANGTVQQDVINFNLPGSVTIALFTQLPEVTSNLIIDGSTQPTAKLGKSDARVYIIPDISYTFPGTKAAALLMTEVTNVEIYGLCIKGYSSKLTNFNGNLLFTAISAYDCSNITIGAPDKGNVFCDNIYGIYCGTNSLTDSKNNDNINIQSNFIGYDESGTNVVELGYALDITADNSLVGGSALKERNYFATAIALNGIDNRFINNSLSLDVNGQDNRGGASILLHFQGSNTQVTDNDFCATTFQFVSVNGFTFIRNKQSSIQGNSGMSLFKCNNALIGNNNINDGNIFSNDGGAFYAVESTNITIAKNSISCNTTPYLISSGTAIPNINVLVNSAAEFSGTASPGAAVYIYNDNTDCSVCNPVQYLTTITADAAGNWKFTGDLHNKKMVANATLNNSSSEYTQPVISTSAADYIKVNPTCFKNNGSITLQNLKNVIGVDWFNEQDQLVQSGGPKLEGVGVGTYYAKCYNGNCFAKSIPVTLTSSNPGVDDSGLQKVNASCDAANGSISNLKLINTNGTTPPLRWTNEAGEVIRNTLDIDGLPGGTYTLTIDPDGCAVPYHVTLLNQELVLDPPVISSFQLCGPGETIIPVSNPVATSTYRLYDSETSTTPLDEEPNGKFKVNVTANRSYYISRFSNACESTRTKVDVSVGLSNLNIANVITPNNDGVNDYWQIAGMENYPAATVKIFNRYGKNIFNSIGYSHPFNGTYNGKPLPTGSYYYIINLSSGCGLLSGSLSIIR
ncbi:gliding motility-associated C-terminal domain-containing protein [Mucilaginibacter gossypiicola]|uniref:Gliding motility-associated C-terminal domain-containing protein n=1 Tax=Mucilaginibacter gossypiicola TaxID=551995 RepID=A0A1H8TNC1_9SPHI|nr:gliding motility-associated C-terminal domain-containing protein [Mucilaginibacter gossypiicola]SEO92367.1 gliding motility-associated C-terminal domain-containing protein [Mucilaginibacter gossypiicola]